MKAKIISLLAITALTVSLFTVSAAADTNATSATVSTTQKKVVAKAPKLVKASASVKVNGSFKLKKVVKKLNKTSKYHFASANKKVASVSSKGKVKGVKKGTTIVNAYQKSTNACVATFKVTVKNRYNKASLRLMSSVFQCILSAYFWYIRNISAAKAAIENGMSFHYWGFGQTGGFDAYDVSGENWLEGFPQALIF